MKSLIISHYDGYDLFEPQDICWITHDEGLDPSDAIRAAVGDFLLTEEGRNRRITWDEILTKEDLVPLEILTRHGIQHIQNLSREDVILVIHNEVLGKKRKAKESKNEG